MQISEHKKDHRRTKITLTLEIAVEQSLNKLIKSGDKSSYVNGVLKEALRREAVKSLNKRLQDIKPISIKEPSLEILRKLRSDNNFIQSQSDSVHNNVEEKS